MHSWYSQGSDGSIRGDRVFFLTPRHRQQVVTCTREDEIQYYYFMKKEDIKRNRKDNGETTKNKQRVETDIFTNARTMTIIS